jgi:hypothetical protein
MLTKKEKASSKRKKKKSKKLFFEVKSTKPFLHMTLARKVVRTEIFPKKKPSKNAVMVFFKTGIFRSKSI